MIDWLLYAFIGIIFLAVIVGLGGMVAIIIVDLKERIRHGKSRKAGEQKL